MSRTARIRRCASPATLIVLALIAGQAAGQPADVDPEPLGMTLQELEEELRRRQEDLGRYSQRLSTLEQQNLEVRGELEGRETVLRRHESQVRARLVTLCRLSQGGYLQLLQDASSVADLFRRAQFARGLVSDDLGALREHQAEVDAITLRRRQLDRRLAAQRQLQERIEQYRLDLEAERERRVNQAARDHVGPSDFDPSRYTLDDTPTTLGL